MNSRMGILSVCLIALLLALPAVAIDSDEDLLALMAYVPADADWCFASSDGGGEDLLLDLIGGAIEQLPERLQVRAAEAFSFVNAPSVDWLPQVDLSVIGEYVGDSIAIAGSFGQPAGLSSGEVKYPLLVMITLDTPVPVRALDLLGVATPRGPVGAMQTYQIRSGDALWMIGLADDVAVIAFNMPLPDLTFGDSLLDDLTFRSLAGDLPRDHYDALFYLNPAGLTDGFPLLDSLDSQPLLIGASIDDDGGIDIDRAGSSFDASMPAGVRPSTTNRP
jgi:hypothetical protein